MGPYNEPLVYFESGEWQMCVMDKKNQDIWGLYCNTPFLGIGETYNPKEIEIFPNPVIENLNLMNLPAGCDILLYDYLGRIVQNLIASDKSVELDMTSLSSGLYYLRIFKERKELINNKIIKAEERK